MNAEKEWEKSQWELTNSVELERDQRRYAPQEPEDRMERTHVAEDPQIEKAVVTMNLAMQKEPSSHDYDWAEEAGVHPSWVGRFRGLKEHNWGALTVDATLSTGYFL